MKKRRSRWRSAERPIPTFAIRSKQVQFLRPTLGHLHFGLYNFVTKHGTLGTTPAVAAGVASQPWSIAELIDRTKDYSPPVIRKTAIEAIIDEVTDEE